MYLGCRFAPCPQSGQVRETTNVPLSYQCFSLSFSLSFPSFFPPSLPLSLPLSFPLSERQWKKYPPSWGFKKEEEKKAVHALTSVAQLVGASSCALKGGRFKSWSGHIPRFWFNPWSVCVGGNQSMFLSCIDISHIHVSLSLSLFLPSSL
uniref:Uncharacterized protein n=1 Tax=Myotis myotis TaxID=51298 RepID=A0A7J7Y003_MYOMY|nr:hypothetical protein mMyoMyo1_011478 [Myotis myotis]